MRDELDLPDEIYGFGGWLLWLVATRSTGLVDLLYDLGPARPSRRYGMAAGHHVPTPSLIAWLLVAAEAGIGVEALAARGALDAERHKVLRTLVSRAISSEPRVFRDSWVRDLAALCGLTPGEAGLLLASRGDGAFPVDPGALARAIERTLAARADTGGRGSGGAVAASRTLPRDAAAFTGREAELSELLAAASESAAGPRVVTIGGMAGVGKTTFAVHSAHLLAPRFPDGQFFLRLHGHTPGQRPADPADALVSLLLTAGVPIDRVPPGLEPRAALWRDAMAGRRVLLLLDDASGHRQVAPLLPAGTECAVLVTSRRRLTALEDAHAISLDSLSADEAGELFRRVAGRAELDKDGVAAITQMCGYLPLAVAMLARQLHHHPAWSAAGLAAELAAELAAGRGRLGMLAAEDVSVSAAFDVTYARLADDLRLLLRRLGLFPGTDLEPWAVAALNGTDRAAAHRALNSLYDHYLLAEPVPGRFRLHDLVREYAGRLAADEPAADREAAITRLADFYYAASAAAGDLVIRERRRPVPVPAIAAAPAVPAFAGFDEAGRWLDREQLNLDAVIRHAAVHRPEHALPMLTVFRSLLARGNREQALGLSKAVLAGMVATGNQLLQAWALIEVLLFQAATGDMRAALASAVRAVTLFERAGDQAGDLEARLYLGWGRYMTDDYQGAVEILPQVLDRFRASGDILGEAEALMHLGHVRYLMSQTAQAAADMEQAVKIFSETGQAGGELSARRYLGAIRQETEDYEAAKANFVRSLALSLETRDRNSEMHVRSSLGYLLCMTGEARDALGHIAAALELARALANRFGEATALNYLGLAQRLTGDAIAAVASERRAVALYQDCGSRLGEANSWQELGAALRQAADPAAEAALARALELYRAIGEPTGEADTLVNLGDLRLDTAGQAAARASYQQALAIYQRLGSPAAARVAALLTQQ